MQKLSKRLEAAAELISLKGGIVADIGTDHGYLPVYLIQSGRCKSAITLDVNKGPLERARQYIKKNRLELVIQTRLSDGFAALKRGEVNSVAITGMGGSLAVQILENGMEQLSAVKELVIGAQSDILKVREFLYCNGIYIDKEDLVYEDGKFYPLLHGVWEKPAYWQEAGYIPFQKELRKKLPDASLYRKTLCQYGEYLLYKKDPALFKLLGRDEKIKRRILDSLSRTRQKEAAKSRQAELEAQLKGILAFLDFFNK